MVHGEPFGSGPALDENFDFIVNTVGDIKDADGLNELEKDLAFVSAFQLEDYIGKPLTPTIRQEIENTLTQIFDAEPRIDAVRDMSVEQVEYGFDVKIDAIVNQEQQNLVFPVGEHL